MKAQTGLGIHALGSLAILLVVVGITIAMGSLINDEIQGTDSIDENSTAYNTTNEVGQSLETLSSFLPIVALVVIAVIIIAVITNVNRVA